MISGIPALISGVALPFYPAEALPWVAISWPPAILGGYRIWRATNPTAALGRDIWWRVRRLLAAVAAGVVVILAIAYPQAVALIVGIWLVAMVLLGIALWSVHRHGDG
jgi:hypothetical protein